MVRREVHAARATVGDARRVASGDRGELELIRISDAWRTVADWVQSAGTRRQERHDADSGPVKESRGCESATTDDACVQGFDD